MILRLSPTEREILIDRLYELAEAEDPFTVLDPYTPGGTGPLAYHGILVAGGVLAVVSLYLREIRVLSVKPHT